jgi:hypothetical protein
MGDSSVRGGKEKHDTDLENANPTNRWLMEL